MMQELQWKPLELSGDIVFDIEYSIGQQTGSLIIQALYGVWFCFFLNFIISSILELHIQLYNAQTVA